MKTLITILIVIGVAGGVYFLMAPRSANGPELSPSPAVSVSPTPLPSAKTPTPKPKTPTPSPIVSPTPGLLIQEAEVHVVDIVGFAFAPATITVKRGDVVVFVNRDSAPHTATADNSLFGSTTIGSEQEWTLTTANLAPGTYAYHCTFHSSMRGTLTIQ